MGHGQVGQVRKRAREEEQRRVRPGGRRGSPSSPATPIRGRAAVLPAERAVNAQEARSTGSRPGGSAPSWGPDGTGGQGALAPA